MTPQDSQALTADERLHNLLQDLEQDRAYWQNRIDTERPSSIDASRWNGCIIGLSEAICRVKNFNESSAFNQGQG